MLGMEADDPPPVKLEEVSPENSVNSGDTSSMRARIVSFSKEAESDQPSDIDERRRAHSTVYKSQGSFTQDNQNVIAQMSNCTDTLLEFRSGVFIKEALYHLFHPFSLPFILYFEGLNYAKNRALFSLSMHIVLVFIMLPLIVLFLYFHPDGVTAAELWLMVVPFIIHKLMVGTKYAYLPREQYESTRTMLLSAEELASFELSHAWARPSPELCEREILFVSKILGFDMSRICFHLNYTEEELRLFCGANAKIKPSRVRKGFLAVCIHTVASCLLHSICASEPAPSFFRYYWFLAVPEASVPFLVRRYYGHSIFGDSIMSGVMVCVVWAISLFNYGVLLLFLSVAVRDLIRRAQTLVALNVLIDPIEVSPVQAEDMYYKALPKNMIFVDLSLADNIISWTVLRQLAQNFGIQYHKRLTMYTTYTFLLVPVLFVFVLTEVLSPANQYPINTATAIGFALYNLLVVALYFCAMLWHGSKANDSYWLHKGCLTRIQMTLRERLSETNNDFRSQKELKNIESRKQIKDSDMMLDSVIRMIENENNVNPVRILGIRASKQYMGSIVTIIGSTLTLGWRTVFQR